MYYVIFYLLITNFNFANNKMTITLFTHLRCG